ncbi:MAG: hypothetical protein WCI73_00545 [Phycisphaerae bacterium]
MNIATQISQTQVVPPPPAATVPVVLPVINAEVPPATTAAAETTTVAAPPKRRGRPKKKTADSVPPVPAGVGSEPVAPEMPAVAPIPTTEPTAVPVVTPDVTSQTGTIVWRDPKTLQDHPLRSVIPPSTIKSQLADDMKERGFLPQFPIQINKNGEILDGEARRDGAIQAELTLVPCVVVELLDELDEADYIFRATLLAKPLSEDQRAVVAEMWRKNRSKQLCTERAQVAGAASAGINLQSVSDNKPKNSRKEAAELFVVPENKLKSIREIEKHFPARLDHIAHGEDTVSKALAAVKEKDHEKELKVRLKKAKALPVLEDWQNQNFEAALWSLKDGTVRAVIMDSDDENQIEAGLKIINLAMLADCHAFVITTWRNEPAIRAALTRQHYEVQGRIIWYLATGNSDAGAKGPVGDEISVIWATRGQVELVGDNGYRIPRVMPYQLDEFSRDGDDRPLHPLQALIEVAALPNERIVAPFGRTGNIVIAARHKGRQIIAIQENEELYAKGKIKIDGAFEGRQRFDQQLKEATADNQPTTVDSPTSAVEPEPSPAVPSPVDDSDTAKEGV